MSELINESEFFDYADFIDHCHSSFDTSNQLIHFNDFIKMNGRIKSIETIKISNIHQKQDEVNEKQDEVNEKQDEVNENQDEMNEKQDEVNENQDEVNEKQDEVNEKQDEVNENQDEVNEKQDEVNVKKEEKIVDFDEIIPYKFDDVRIQDDSSPQKIFEIDESTKFFVFPLSDFEKLNVKCEKIVNDAQYDIEKQFIVGKRMLEGNGDFQQNVSVGLKYIKHSMSKNFLQSIIYYSRMLIKGNIIKKDLEKAKKIIHSISKTKDNQIFVLNGKIAKKEKNFKEARYHFLNGLKNKDDESIYKYAKMLFLGEGGKKNEKEAFKYFNELNSRGYSKSGIFINIYSKLCKVKGFKRLATESQYIFIKNNDLNKITVNPKKNRIDLF
ncbi:hypothetical protein M9Y10_019884 [Tritrichomonas musculus]|uniref:Uncharacterized protein n=1 Tax=Tritrichomonas musculus TaxID=1915356 RepID=A0ABR2HHK0_9EUKA